MNDQDFDKLMNAAVRDDSLFEAALAESREDLIEWMRNTLLRVRLERKVARAEWSAQGTLLRFRSPEWRAMKVSHDSNEAKSRRFEMHLIKRLNEIGVPLQGKQEVKKDDTVRRLSDERGALRLALLDLAGAIEEYESGDIARNDLVRKLDEVKVPHGAQDELSIREVMALRRKGGVTA